MIALVAILGAALGFLALVGALALAHGDTRRSLQLLLARRIPPLAPDVVVAGDSLAACCPFRTLRRRPFGVLSLARGGATLKEIAGQVGQARDFSPRWLVLDGGLNDLLVDSATPDRIAEDFEALLRRRPEGAQAIFTLAPLTSNAADAPRIRAANERLRALCLASGICVVDLNPLVASGDARLPEMTDDGLHFSPAANAIWVDAVARIVAGAAPQVLAMKNKRG